MSARFRALRMPEPDGLMVGVALATANVLGIGAVACVMGIVPTVPDAPSAAASDDDRPVCGPRPDQQPHSAERRETNR